MKKLTILLTIVVGLIAIGTAVNAQSSNVIWEEFCFSPNYIEVRDEKVSCLLGETPLPTPLPTPNPECDWPNETPAGSLPSQPPPVFCLITNTGPGTEVQADNYWSDDFNHDLSFSDFQNTNYLLYDNVGAWQSIHWRHADHWMVDLAPHPEDTNVGYAHGLGLIRPNQSFHFEDGVLTIEVVAAAGMDAYLNNEAWPEIVVSTASDPYSSGSMGLYAYDQFPENWTLGCRLQNTRVPVCTLKADDGSMTIPRQSTRIWEMSFFQHVGTGIFGGYPANGLENYWNDCAVNEPDFLCRDKFRLELRVDSLALYVNDKLYFEQTGIPQLPDSLLNGDVYVYFASVQARHPADTIRFHWDDININP